MAARRDLALFPGASGGVRVGTRRWNPRHADVLERIFQHIELDLQCNADVTFDDLLRDFERRDPRVQVGDQYAHVLYGPTPLFLAENGELQMDVHGLVYKPQARKFGSTLVAEFGGEV